LDSASDGSNDAAEVSALVIQARGKLKTFFIRRDAGGGVMHTYHNVAKLRQFHGVTPMIATYPAIFALKGRDGCIPAS
jgi:hypothetical protein